MKLFEDLRIKHITAFVSHEIGESVTALSGILINNSTWYNIKNDERIEDSDFQLVAIYYYYFDADGKRVDDCGVFRWRIYDEELSYEGTTEEYEDVFFGPDE